MQKDETTSLVVLCCCLNHITYAVLMSEPHQLSCTDI